MNAKPPPALGKRLASLMHVPGGSTAAEAVAAAEQRLETIRDRGMDEIAETIARMQALGPELAGGRTAAADELYAASNTLVGVAAIFGMPFLGDAAFSLCTLLDRQAVLQVWHYPAVKLHLDSLGLLHTGLPDAAGAQAINAALRKVTLHVCET